MIMVAGQAERSFLFPADIDTAYAFYSDIGRLISYLPYIDLLHNDAENSHLRVKYSTTELSTYLINIISDIEYELDPPNYTYLIRPIDRLPAIKPQTTMNSTSARGYFTLESRFMLGNTVEETLIEYRLTMQARLPTPGALRFMPGRIVSSITSGITNGRIKEIIDGFITNSIEAYGAQINQEA